VKKSTDTEPLNVLKQKFTGTINLPKGTKIALQSLHLYYSWYNITSALGNNSLSYIHDGVTYPVVFPDGFYSILDIDGFLKFTMKANGHYLVDGSGSEVYYISMVENSVYNKFTFTLDVVPNPLPVGYSNPAGMVLTGTTMSLVIPATPIRDVLGLNAQTYPAAPAAVQQQKNSDYIPQITEITTVFVKCDLVNNILFNASASNVLYTFSPSSSFGSFLSIEPSNLIFLPTHTAQFSEINLTLTDQFGRTLNVLDYNMNATILIELPE
jgi:hypothetical protein